VEVQAAGGSLVKLGRFDYNIHGCGLWALGSELWDQIKGPTLSKHMHIPRAQSPEPRAQSPEPRAQSPEPRAQSPDPRAL